MSEYPQIINETGSIDCLATQLAGMYIDEKEQERLELETMREQHKTAVNILSNERMKGE